MFEAKHNSEIVNNKRFIMVVEESIWRSKQNVNFVEVIW